MTVATDKFISIDEARQVVGDSTPIATDCVVNDVAFDYQRQSDGDVLMLNYKSFSTDVHKSIKGSINDLFGIKPSTLSEYRDDPDLVQSLLKHSLSKRKNEHVKIVTSGSTIIDVLPGHSNWHSPVQIFDLVTSLHGNEIIGLSNIKTDGVHMDMRFVTGQVAEPPKRKGDISHAGVWINSNGEVKLSPFVYRLVCSNGLRRDERLCEYDVNFGEEFPAELNKVFAESNKALERFIQLDENIVAEPANALTHFATTNKIKKSVYKTLMDRVASLPKNPTEYDVVNFITSLGVELDDDSFENIGGLALGFFGNNRCSHCAHRL